MAYTPGTVAQADVQAELYRVSRELQAPALDYLSLKVWHATPARPFEGMVVLADGTDWDPGSGAGVYWYDGAAWNHLG